MERLAHSLKGAVATFGAYPAQSLAYELGRRGRQGELADAASILPQLQQELRRIAVFVAEQGWDERIEATNPPIAWPSRENLRSAIDIATGPDRR